ncbi:hypothetical protein H2248_009377 [Termitomyces sp. 'cryptogamus']|nr:hypothetical protein H2248_009377 [Termitomyces sp. 'cryptogamus']
MGRGYLRNLRSRLDQSLMNDQNVPFESKDGAQSKNLFLFPGEERMQRIERPSQQRKKFPENERQMLFRTRAEPTSSSENSLLMRDNGNKFESKTERIIFHRNTGLGLIDGDDSHDTITVIRRVRRAVQHCLDDRYPRVGSRYSLGPIHRKINIAGCSAIFEHSLMYFFPAKVSNWVFVSPSSR